MAKGNQDVMRQLEAAKDARKVSDAMMRCLAKCIACFGIGLYIYAGEDLPDTEPEVIDAEPMINAIMQATSLDDLKTVYFGVVKMAKGNQDVMRQLEAAKDARKNQLMEAA